MSPQSVDGHAPRNIDAASEADQIDNAFESWLDNELAAILDNAKDSTTLSLGLVTSGE